MAVNESIDVVKGDQDLDSEGDVEQDSLSDIECAVGKVTDKLGIIMDKITPTTDHILDIATDDDHFQNRPFQHLDLPVKCFGEIVHFNKETLLVDSSVDSFSSYEVVKEHPTKDDDIPPESNEVHSGAEIGMVGQLISEYPTLITEESLGDETTDDYTTTSQSHILGCETCDDLSAESLVSNEEPPITVSAQRIIAVNAEPVISDVPEHPTEASPQINEEHPNILVKQDSLHDVDSGSERQEVSNDVTLTAEHSSTSSIPDHEIRHLDTPEIHDDHSESSTSSSSSSSSSESEAVEITIGIDPRNALVDDKPAQLSEDAHTDDLELDVETPDKNKIIDDEFTEETINEIDCDTSKKNLNVDANIKLDASIEEDIPIPQAVRRRSELQDEQSDSSSSSSDEEDEKEQVKLAINGIDVTLSSGNSSICSETDIKESMRRFSEIKMDLDISDTDKGVGAVEAHSKESRKSSSSSSSSSSHDKEERTTLEINTGKLDSRRTPVDDKAVDVLVYLLEESDTDDDSINIPIKKVEKKVIQAEVKDVQIPCCVDADVKVNENNAVRVKDEALHDVDANDVIVSGDEIEKNFSIPTPNKASEDDVEKFVDDQISIVLLKVEATEDANLPLSNGDALKEVVDTEDLIKDDIEEEIPEKIIIPNASFLNPDEYVNHDINKSASGFDISSSMSSQDSDDEGIPRKSSSDFKSDSHTSVSTQNTDGMAAFINLDAFSIASSSTHSSVKVEELLKSDVPGDDCPILPLVSEMDVSLTDAEPVPSNEEKYDIDINNGSDLESDDSEDRYGVLTVLPEKKVTVEKDDKVNDQSSSESSSSSDEDKHIEFNAAVAVDSMEDTSASVPDDDTDNIEKVLMVDTPDLLEGDYSTSEDDDFYQSSAMQSILDQMTSSTSNFTEKKKNEDEEDKYSSSSRSTVARADDIETPPPERPHHPTPNVKEDTPASINELDAEKAENVSEPDQDDIDKKSSEDSVKDEKKTPEITPLKELNRLKSQDSIVASTTLIMLLEDPDSSSDGITSENLRSSTVTSTGTSDINSTLRSDVIGTLNSNDRLLLKTKFPKRNPVAGKSFGIACKVKMKGFTLKPKDVKKNVRIQLFRDNSALELQPKFKRGYFIYKMKNASLGESGVYKIVVNLLDYEAEDEQDINIVMEGDQKGRSNLSSIGSLGSLGSMLSIKRSGKS